MLTLLALLATQTAAASDTIAGAVTGPTGRPLAGAIVQATSLVTRVSRSQTTDGGGRFLVLFPERGAQYQLTVRYFGLKPLRGTVPLGARALRVPMMSANLSSPIDSILGVRESLGLSSDQVRRLQTIAAGDSGTLPALESARNVLTLAQWARLSTGAAGSVVMHAPAPPSPPPAPVPPSPEPAAPRAQQVPVTRPDLKLYTGVTTVHETNLTHAPLDAELDSYGVLLGAGGDYRRRSRHTTLELQYNGVLRRYSGTDRWNVPGHQGSVAVTQRVTRRWAVGGEAGFQLNGSAEDRVLRNEYTAEADREYRLHGTGRLQLYGEYMAKRYPDQLGNDAADPRVGLKYRQDLGATGTWGIGGRYDYNRADSSRYQYAGWTASTDLGLPLGSAGRISAYFRYNIRNYSSRMVTVDTGQELRRDADNVAMVTWGQGIARVWEVVVNYR